MSRIATDENLHMIFYRNILGATLELDPDHDHAGHHGRRQGLPDAGHSIEGFTRKSAVIANAGIYDVRQHKDQVLAPVLRQWKVWDIEGLDAEGEEAREELDEFLDEPRDRRLPLRGAPGRPGRQVAARDA